MREVWGSVNPVTLIQSTLSAARDLPGTARHMLQAQGKVGQEALDAFEAGDYATGTRKALNWLVPIIGPQIDRAGDLMNEGRYGAGVGAAVGVGAQLAAPAVIGKVKSVTPRVLPRNPNAATRAAVEFGQREGIPVDAATSSGNRFVGGVQKLADESIGGSVVAGRARQTQAQALTQTGERLAAKTAPAVVTTEQAGQGVRDALTTRAASFNAAADAAYTQLRTLETAQAGRIAATGGVRGPATAAKPFTNVPLAVDIAPTKAAMQPIYTTLKREAELVPLMGDKARALTALDRLMTAPDVAPLSVADAALSELKTLSRVDQTFRRTAGQGATAQAVTNLDRAVVAAATQAGPEAFKALMGGRAATVNKFKTIDLLDKLNPSEPVRVFNQLTAGKDAGIALLRDVGRQAPQELPKIGRAYLEGLLEKATAEGGFGRGAGVYADWQRLGTQSKLMLFRNAGLVRDLDNFFLLAKRIADNPNPSGTALTLSKQGEGLLLVTNPALGVPVSVGATALSKLLHSPAAVKTLTRGLRIPVGQRAAATAASAELAKLVEEAGVTRVPATADQQQ